jgi:HEPN domain-containing protein
MKPGTRAWLERADEDILVLSKLDVNETPNHAAVTAAQVLEQYLKACWVELGLRSPLTHDLELLWQGILEHFEFDLSPADLSSLTPHGTQGRYHTLKATPERAASFVALSLSSCPKLRTWLEART